MIAAGTKFFRIVIVEFMRSPYQYYHLYHLILLVFLDDDGYYE